MFKECNQNQTQLLPPNLTDLIVSDHIARLINQVIDEMDLKFIENTYSEMGQHAYHPRMLLKVLVYGYTVGIRSSRKLADRLNEDTVFMWLAGRQNPDFRTIADFRKSKLGDVKKVFKQVLDLCQQLGLIRIGKVCFDGTKLRADVSANKIQYRKVLERRKDKINKLVDDILSEAEKIDRQEEALYGNKTEHQTGMDIEQVKKKLAKLKQKKESFKNKRLKLEAKKSDIDTKLRKIRKDRNTMSTTDKDATLMLMKEGHIAPAYNVQLATEHQIILAYGVYSNRNDLKLLKPMIKEVKENTDKNPEMSIADAGFGSKSNYRFLKNQRIAGFIPYNNFNKEMIERRKGIYHLPKKVDTELERYKARQRLRLLSEEGKKIFARRKEDIEPTIGDIKRNMNFRSFHLRGRSKCLIELSLVSIGHNLKKIKNWVKKLSKQEDGSQKINQLGTILGYLPV